MKKRFWSQLAVLLCIWVAMVSILGRGGETRAQPVHVAVAADCAHVMTLIPDQMTLSGDVATASNSTDDTVRSWFADTEPGTIILGVDPASNLPANWDGGQAKAEVYIGDVVTRTVATVRITWADSEAKGIHSPDPGAAARMWVDGYPLWAMRTTQRSTFGDCYAVQQSPVIFTFVVTQSMTHTLAIQVDPHTAWDISRIEIEHCPMPGQLRGFAYGPFRYCQNPDIGVFPTVDEIEADIPSLFHNSNGIRTYSACGVQAKIPRLAQPYGLRVAVGAWLGRDLASNENEIAGAIALANQYPNVESVIVGNEVLLRNDLTEDQLLGYINRVKAAVAVPVTTAETSWLLLQHPNLIAACDYLMVHVYSWWDQWSGTPIGDRVEYVIDAYQDVQQRYPGQRVVLGETGWPSAGPGRNGAEPSITDQCAFYSQFLRRANEENVEFYYFSAYDEPWKNEGDGIGKYWGVIDQDRFTKHRFQGMLWPAEALNDGLCAQPMSYPVVYFSPVIKYGGTPLPSPTPDDSVFNVYTEQGAATNHYLPTGWMGDIEDIGLYECWPGDPHIGDTAIKVHYSAEGSRGLGWAGVYWQYPANNWGDQPGGYDLAGAKGVKFWAKGAKGGEWISFKVGGVGCDEAAYPDSLCPAEALATSPISLTDTWELYALRLRPGLDLSRVMGGFCWAASRADNPQGALFYLDDVQYVYDEEFPLQPHAVYYGHRLADGYSMGVNTSGGRTDWVTDMGGYMRMSYPSGQSWGAVFITVGPPKTPPRPSRDLSEYHTLSLELRGEQGGEEVWVGLKDSTDPDSGMETKKKVDNLGTDWQTYTFPLNDFVTADLTRLYVMTEFVFEAGTPAETVYFRNIRYLP